MRHFFLFLVAPIILFSIVSCEDDINDNDANMNSSLMTFTANLNGTNEVPMPDNPSNETGKAILTFDDTTKIFTVTVTHSIISPVSGHIYIGEADESGNPIFTFTSSISPIYYSSPPLTDSQEADLKSNLFYINILTEAHRTGEIRGQFIELTSK